MHSSLLVKLSFLNTNSAEWRDACLSFGSGLLTAATPVGGKQINFCIRYEEKLDFAISSLFESLAKVYKTKNHFNPE